MAHTFSCLRYHIVFSAAGRRNLIPQEQIAPLHRYIEGIVKNIHGRTIAIGGTVNHVHLLISLRPETSASKAVNVIKSNSSKWIHETLAKSGAFIITSAQRWH